MGSRGSGFEQENTDIRDAQDFDELKSALEKSIGGNVFIWPDVKKKANFEKVKNSMQALDKITKMFPFMKGHDLEMIYKTGSSATNTMTAFGRLSFYSSFWKKNNPSEIPGYGHPDNWDDEATIAHELGHYVEGLLLKKQNPAASNAVINMLYSYDAGFKDVFASVKADMVGKGWNGHDSDLLGQVSLYGKKFGWSEAGADAIADVMKNGKNASEVSRLFVNYLNKAINK